MGTKRVRRPSGPTVASSGQTGWRWQYAFAGAGAVFLAWETWTIVAWLRAGPEQITAYRNRDSAAWIAARIYEAGMVALATVVLVHVIRGCRRQGRLTWDA